NCAAAVLALEKTPPNFRLAIEALQDIEGGVQRTSGVFESIGALFGRTEAPRVWVDLNQIAADALHSLKSEVAEYDVKVHDSLEPNLPRVMGRRNQLLEVVINIVSNAIEAMKTVEGRERLLRIETRLDDRNGVAVLVVRDTGPGIDPVKAPEI